MKSFNFFRIVQESFSPMFSSPIFAKSITERTPRVAVRNRLRHTLITDANGIIAGVAVS